MHAARRDADLEPHANADAAVDVGARAPRVYLVLVALAVALALAHALSYVGSGPVDDDYIDFRYARNLVEGHGLVFNVSERVEGFTPPLWVLLIAAALRCGAAAPTTAVVVGCASAALAVAALASAWRTLRSQERAPWPALVLAASAALAWHAVAGLGTALLAALLALWAASYIRAHRDGRASRGACAWLALAALLRPEAVVFALPYALVECRRARRAWPLLVFAPLAGWIAFRCWYYGRLVPVTWLVKRLPLATDLAFGARYLVESTRSAGIGVLLLGVLALLVLRTRRDSRESSEPDALRVIALGTLAHAAYVVAVGGDYLALARFFVPALPLLVLLGVHVLFAFVSARALRVACVVALALAVLRATFARHERFELHAFDEQRWLAIGRELARSAPSDTRVALAPVGAIGYESRLPIVDLLGRTNDAIWRVAPDTSIPMKGHQRYDAEWALAQQPDVVILGNGVLLPGTSELVVSAWERTLYTDPRFQRDYVAHTLPIADSYPLAYFQRRGGKQPRGAQPIGALRQR